MKYYQKFDDGEAIYGTNGFWLTYKETYGQKWICSKFAAEKEWAMNIILINKKEETFGLFYGFYEKNKSVK